MKDRAELLPTEKHLVVVTAMSRPQPADGLTFVTKDHEVVQRWADKRQATPFDAGL
jgi:hypothetical protein